MTNKDFIEYLIGKSIEEARLVCVESNRDFRVVREDSTQYIITMDLRLNRINVEVDNGIITFADIG